MMFIYAVQNSLMYKLVPILILWSTETSEKIKLLSHIIVIRKYVFFCLEFINPDYCRGLLSYLVSSTLYGLLYRPE